MKRIKILYGLEASDGGALKHLAYLVGRLDRGTFDITVVLSRSRKGDITEVIEEMESVGAKVQFLPMCRSINPVKDFIAFFQLFFLINRGKFDIVHAHSSKAGALFRSVAWLCKVSLICYTPHCFYFQGKKGIKKAFFLSIEKLLAKITTFIIVSENEQKEIIKNRLAKPIKILNINNAIDFNEYKQNKEISETKLHYGINPNAFVVGSIGRLVPQKDYKTLIYTAKEVLKSYPGTIFLIAGKGQLFTELQELVLKLKLEDSVILVGHVKEIWKIYGIIDILVSTSLWEGLPYVFLEAMRYEKAIIATDTGNDTTIIHDETGFITSISDHVSIAKKIIKLIENKQLAIQMGKKGNKRLTQKYSFEHFIQQHEILYEKGVNFR